VRRVVDKLLHAPTVRVKQLASEPDGGSYAEALRKLFDLDIKTVEAVSGAGASDGAGTADVSAIAGIADIEDAAASANAATDNAVVGNAVVGNAVAAASVDADSKVPGPRGGHGTGSVIEQ